MAPQDYDDDDFVDQYDEDLGEEEDEMSPEDKIAMQKGTEEVRKALGEEASKVTVAQIQEALWHYYYDVDKSVAYLKRTFIAPPPKPAPKAAQKPTPKKAPEGKNGALSLLASGNSFVRPLGEDDEYTPTIYDIPPLARAFPILEKPRIPPNFFDDMPWLNIPRDRETMFVEPLRPRGGLLGGTGSAPKVSKLQALAAMRKRKLEEKKAQESPESLEGEVTKLALSDANKENMGTKSKLQRRNSSTGSSTPQEQPQEQGQNIPTASAEDSLGERASSPIATESKADDVIPEAPKPVMSRSHAPSAFAQALFEPDPEAEQRHRRDVFAMPYTQSSLFVASVFSEPSPDDIVLAARAKGSNFAKAK